MSVKTHQCSSNDRPNKVDQRSQEVAREVVRDTVEEESSAAIAVV